VKTPMTATKLMKTHMNVPPRVLGEVQFREQRDGVSLAGRRWKRAWKRKQNARASRTNREKTLV
jgi:hypothetical protein